jgi:hypothetical protein
MVSVLAFGAKVHGFLSGQGYWIFKGDENHSMPSFRGDIKLSAPYHKIAWRVKEPFKV